MFSFWGGPSEDLQLTILFIGISFVLALIIGGIKRDFFLAIIIFSVFTNTTLLLSGTIMYRAYNILWLQYVAVFILPIINIYLIYRYVTKKSD